MVGKRSNWSKLILASAIAAAASAWMPASILRAQDAAASAPAPDAAAAPAATPTADAASQPAAPDAKLTSLADDTLHYIIVGNIQLAHDSGQAFLDAKPDPAAALAAFESAANGRDIFATLMRGNRIDQLRDVTSQLNDLLEQGERSVARDPARIRHEIERLANGPRAYENAKSRLVAAGPYAVPLYIDYLNKQDQTALHPYIIKVMTEIGKPVIAPLCAEMVGTPDAGQKLTYVKMLGDIGYPQALPALKQVAEQAGSDADLKSAALNAINKLDPQNQMGSISASEAYVYMAMGLLEKRPQFAPFAPNEPTNPIWYYNASLSNIDGVPVPTAVWYEDSAKRAAEQALKLSSSNGAAISVWLAAEFRRSLRLPQGVTDPTVSTDAPKPEYYALAAGPTYLIPVLKLALDTNDPALALKAVAALEQTAGTSTLVGEANVQLVRALSSGDRAVRFTTAFALGRANPAHDFAGSQRVVPVLAEAVSQTGVPNVLVVEPESNNRNRIADDFRTKLNDTVYDGSSVAEAINSANRAASFDAVVVDVNQVSSLMEFARSDYRLANCPIIVTTDAATVPGFAARMVGTPHVKVVDVQSDDAAFKAAIEGVKATIASTPMDAAAATSFATTAIHILGSIAADHGSIYKVQDAVPALSDAVKDKRTDIAMAAGQVLGTIGTPDAQSAIASAALDPGLTDGGVKTSLLGSLAESAKRAGNNLDAGQINSLIKIVQTEPDVNVKTAAAQVLGALNIPSNQASTLIMQQAK